MKTDMRKYPQDNRTMDYVIRPIREEEYPVLEEYLYQAIFVPEGTEKPDREILKQPEMQVYVEHFGEDRNDLCLVAEKDKNVIGAVWTRIMKDYGHISDTVPSLAISILPQYRGNGIGTILMEEMMKLLKEKGFSHVSLSVQKQNKAVGLYRNVGFHVYRESDDEYIMIKDL